MVPAVPPVHAALIGKPDIRRLIVAQIEAFQMRQIRDGRSRESFLLSAHPDFRVPDPALDPAPDRALDTALDRALDIVIGEDDLGIDSLDRLGLVTALSRFFGLDATGVEDYFLLRRRLGDWVDLTALHFERIGAAARIAFSTSGSTGDPKVVCHDRAALESEVRVMRDGPLAAEPAGRIIAMVPPHHIYGFLWSVLLPRLTGRAVVDLTMAVPGKLFRIARPGDLVVATPYGWGQLGGVSSHAPDPAHCRLPAGVTGLTSGGPTTAATWRIAQDIGLSRLVEIYGATETGGLGWRSDAAADFTLLDDVAMDGAALSRHGKPLDPQDNLAWTGDRRFRVLGRRDSVVQVAGTNVNIDALRDRILGVTGAQDAALRLSGDRLKAFIAVPPQQEAEVREAVQALLRRLPAPERPAEIRFGAALPRTPVGKLANW